MPQNNFTHPHARGRTISTLKGVLITAFCILALTLTHQAYATETETNKAPPAPQTDVVIVVGAPGTPEYGKQFSEWAATWLNVSEQAAASTTMIGQTEPDDSNDRDQLQESIKALTVKTAATQNPLWLVLIGHGTFAQNTPKFNLRGPDVSAIELAEWLQNTKRPIVIVNCASASGPFINQLSGKNRVIVTATKSGTEQNYARFGEFLAKAIASSDSDIDHDDEVSIQEAFLRASAGVQQFYEEAGRISTEHALIDDNGDARGTPATMFRGTRRIAKAKDGATLDGREASRITLTPTATRLPFTQDELAQRNDLETQLEELRQRHQLEKSSLNDPAIDADLEPLMIQLAKLYQAAEQRQKDAQ